MFLAVERSRDEMLPCITVLDEAGTARCMSRLALCMRPALEVGALCCRYEDTGPGCLRHTHGLVPLPCPCHSCASSVLESLGLRALRAN